MGNRKISRLGGPSVFGFGAAGPLGLVPVRAAPGVVFASDLPTAS